MQLFPKDFLWGASTASHQVEGDTHNQWSEWEKAQAHHLARTAQQRLQWLPNWNNIAKQAQDPANYISGKAVDHYNRYREDFDLITQLNMNAFRFGIEWARIEPREGEWDEAAVEHYKTYLQELKKRGITPVVTLWHWTMPVWFTDKGGFEKRANLAHFERYVRKICELFDENIGYIITLNEPNVYTHFGYLSGEWPPQQKSITKTYAVYRNLAHAHRRAYRIIKEMHPHLPVGISAQLADTLPLRPHNIVNKLSVAAATYIWNWWFLNRLKQHQDFIGINYYFTEYRNWLGQVKNPPKPVSDLGWYMDPGSIRSILNITWQRYRIPLLITENGLADADDSQRTWWIEQTIAGLQSARRDGVAVCGYLHWSLLDNFEWAYGWWPQFGLVHVDRTTMRRTIRASAYRYAELIRDNQPKR